MEKPPTASGPLGPGRPLDASFVDGTPHRTGEGDYRLTEASLSALLDRIEAASVYVRRMESDAQEWEHIVAQVHARMYARIVEVEEKVRSAEASARDERARAEIAEGRLHSLEQLILNIAVAVDEVGGNAGP